jgi:CTP synthase
VVEFARNVAGLAEASSSEFDKETTCAVIDLMPEQRMVRSKGASMRLGAYPCTLTAGSLVAEAYGATEISERHRHRYEFSNEYREQLTAAGLILSGTSPDRRLVEVVELADHPYFVGCQFHPEFRSRPAEPHPLFARFVRAGLERRNEMTASRAAEAASETS